MPKVLWRPHAVTLRQMRLAQELGKCFSIAETRVVKRHQEFLRHNVHLRLTSYEAVLLQASQMLTCRCKASTVSSCLRTLAKRARLRGRMQERYAIEALSRRIELRGKDESINVAPIATLDEIRKWERTLAVRLPEAGLMNNEQ